MLNPRIIADHLTDSEHVGIDVWVPDFFDPSALLKHELASDEKHGSTPYP
jgi:hypothetical protein